MNTLAALLLSIVAVFITLKLKLHVSIAIFVGAIVLAVLSSINLNELLLLLLKTSLSIETWRLVIIISSAIGLGVAMDLKGLLGKLAETLENIGTRTALYIAPALIGLVPMPAGAVVSASMVKDIARKTNLTPEEAAFLNYWFRHIIEYSWPIYQGIILTGIVFSISIVDTVKTLCPMTAINALIGLAISYYIFKKKPLKKKFIVKKNSSLKQILEKFTYSTWPIFLIIALILVLKIDASIAFPTSLIMLIITGDFKAGDVTKILRKALDPKIVFLPIATMFYKAIVEHTNLAYQIFNLLLESRIPEYFILSILPFIVGFTTGISFAFVGITFPLLVPIIGQGSIDSGALILSYVSGMAGVLLSPMHLCLVLSIDYFGAKLPETYNLVLFAVLASMVSAFTIHLSL